MYTHSLVALSLFILSFVDTFDHPLSCPLIFPLTYHSHTLSHLLAPPRKPSFSISCNESSLLHSTHSPALSLCLSLVASPCAFSFPAAHPASRCASTHPRTRIFPLLLASPFVYFLLWELFISHTTLTPPPLLPPRPLSPALPPSRPHI